MKKRGVTYTEILVAITIFSLGVVPMLLSLGDSFEKTVYNRSYTKALEYNRQLFEEIKTSLPRRLSDEEPEVYRDRIVTTLKSRDESQQKKSYFKAKLDDGTYQFDGNDTMDSSIYRRIEVGVPEDNTYDENNVVIGWRIPVGIEARISSTGELIIKTNFNIYLEKE